MIVNVEITVFTPTYNRAYIINRLYESLQRQEIHNFEWLVVDDGSVDETEELFRTWMNNESKFPIRYYKKKNGGKCRAINFALCIFRKNCASVPEERSAIPLQTEQSSAG